MRRPDAAELLEIRIEAGHPPSLEESFYSEYLQKLREKALTTFSRPEFVSDALESHDGSIPRKLSRTLGRVPYAQFAEQALNRRNLPAFRFYYDLQCGLVGAAYLIQLGEDHIAGETEAMSNFIKTNQATDPDGLLSTPSDKFAEGLKYTEIASKLLLSDPTGLEVFEFGVRVIQEEEPWPYKWQSKQYSLAGAELARDGYQILYTAASQSRHA